MSCKSLRSNHIRVSSDNRLTVPESSSDFYAMIESDSSQIMYSEKGLPFEALFNRQTEPNIFLKKQSFLSESMVEYEAEYLDYGYSSHFEPSTLSENSSSDYNPQKPPTSHMAKLSSDGCILLNPTSKDSQELSLVK